MPSFSALILKTLLLYNNPRHCIYVHQKADLDGVSSYMNQHLYIYRPIQNSAEQNWLLFKGANPYP